MVGVPKCAQPEVRLSKISKELSDQEALAQVISCCPVTTYSFLLQYAMIRIQLLQPQQPGPLAHQQKVLSLNLTSHNILLVKLHGSDHP